MSKPRMTNHPMYLLLRQGEVAEFNRRKAAGESTDLVGCDLKMPRRDGMAFYRAMVEIVPALERIQVLVGERIPAHGIDGEVTIACVFFNAGCHF